MPPTSHAPLLFACAEAVVVELVECGEGCCGATGHPFNLNRVHFSPGHPPVRCEVAETVTTVSVERAARSLADEEVRSEHHVY
jgi:hypothetical protein